MRISSLVALAAATVTSICVAACGQSAQTRAGTTNRSSNASQGVKFSQCMREHGLGDFPDVVPGQGLPIQHDLNGGVSILVNGVPQPVSSPKLDSALHSCARDMLGVMSSPVGAGVTPGTIQRALVLTAECMRRSGVTGYPDPPALGTQVQMHLSPSARARDAGINIDSPTFKSANAKCGRIMSRRSSGS